MGQFKVDKSNQGGQLIMTFEGSVDEDAVFSGIDFEGASEVVLDLDKVSAINSCGIREWIKWIRTAPANAKITYRKCPKIIVDQINMVSGFLPENAEVESFYVPYYSDESGNEKMILFEKGKDFENGEIKAPSEFKDEESGDEMEMDVIEAKYFKFLSKS